LDDPGVTAKHLLDGIEPEANETGRTRPELGGTALTVSDAVCYCPARCCGALSSRNLENSAMRVALSLIRNTLTA
jgi:hypothetical protein